MRIDAFTCNFQAVAVDHPLHFQGADAGDVESAKRRKDKDAVDAVQHFRGKALFAQSSDGGTAQCIRIVGKVFLQLGEGIGRSV